MEINLILNELKRRGLIGKKNSAFKQARQAKLKKMKENEVKKSPNPKKILKEIKVPAENKQQEIKIEEKEMNYNRPANILPNMI